MFLGREVVDGAVARGWRVTTFNRGVSGPDRPGVDVLRGDRQDAAAIGRAAQAGPWDAVIDCSAYVPRNVLQVAEALRPHADRFVLMSSVSAYAGWPTEPLTEESPTLPCPPSAGPEHGEDVEDGPTQYGYQKSGCEVAAREVFGDSAFALRLGVLLGPREYVGRLPWWLRRVDRGGEVLAPGDPQRTIQPLDVRDAAQFALLCAQGDVAGGSYNLTAPIGHAAFGGMLTSCTAATGSDATLRWIPDEKLVEAGVRQWSEMPLWRTMPGTWAVDSSRAQAAGLTARPLDATVRDTWAWMQTGDQVDGKERSSEIGLDPEREAALLAELRPDVRAG